MSSKVMLVGGLASLATIPIWLLVIVLVPDFDFGNLSSAASAALLAGSIATMVAFVGMYYLFPGRSPLNLLLVGLGVVGVALTVVPTDPAWAYNAGAILWGAALLVAGYLLRASHSVWLSWVGFASGALFVAVGVVGFTGPADLANMLNMISTVPVLVWAVWIGWVMVREARGQMAASPA